MALIKKRFLEADGAFMNEVPGQPSDSRPGKRGLNLIKTAQLRHGKTRRRGDANFLDGALGSKPCIAEVRVTRNLDNIVVIKKRGKKTRSIIAGGGFDEESHEERARKAEDEAMRVQIQAAIARVFGSQPDYASNKRLRKRKPQTGGKKNCS